MEGDMDFLVALLALGVHQPAQRTAREVEVALPHVQVHLSQLPHAAAPAAGKPSAWPCWRSRAGWRRLLGWRGSCWRSGSRSRCGSGRYAAARRCPCSLAILLLTHPAGMKGSFRLGGRPCRADHFACMPLSHLRRFRENCWTTGFWDGGGSRAAAALPACSPAGEQGEAARACQLAGLPKKSLMPLCMRAYAAIRTGDQDGQGATASHTKSCAV